MTATTPATKPARKTLTGLLAVVGLTVGMLTYASAPRCYQAHLHLLTGHFPGVTARPST